jgi:hypothetical protein
MGGVIGFYTERVSADYQRRRARSHFFDDRDCLSALRGAETVVSNGHMSPLGFDRSWQSASASSGATVGTPPEGIHFGGCRKATVNRAIRGQVSGVVGCRCSGNAALRQAARNGFGRGMR